MNKDMDRKIEICKQTRKIAADSLFIVLKKLLKSKKPISEVMLRDAWLEEMRKNRNIFPNGWYDPPPDGIIVLFGSGEKTIRLNYKTARLVEFWPKDDSFLDPKDGILYCYASPVDKKTGIIGDFGISLYLGKNPEIIKLLQKCLSLDKEIFDYVQVGMKFSEIALEAEKLMKKHGMVNEVVTFTDRGEMVIGHTIPDAVDDWKKKEQATFLHAKNEWDKCKAIISLKRVNIKMSEQFAITKGTAITIETRPTIVSKPQLPESLSYHTIAYFDENGEKELITNFDELFTLVGMGYMMEQ